MGRIAFGLLLLLLSVGRAYAADLSFSPAQIDLAAGESQVVAVNVSGLSASEPGLGAFQFSLEFDDTRIQIQDPNRGTPLNPLIPLGGDPFCGFIATRAACSDPVWFLTSTGRDEFRPVITPPPRRTRATKLSATGPS